MSDMNRVTLLGRMGKDPEIRFTQGGEPIASFSLATSERWNDKSGQKQERTQWHNVSVFGKLAEIVRDYTHKGKQLLVEGSVEYEEWTDKDGVTRKTTKIKVTGFNGRIVLLGGKNDGASEGGAAEQQRSNNGGSRPATQKAIDGWEVSDDDVPF